MDKAERRTRLRVPGRHPRSTPGRDAAEGVPVICPVLPARVKPGAVFADISETSYNVDPEEVLHRI